MRVLSHESAARIDGIPLLRDDGREYVTVPRNHGRVVIDGVVHRADLAPEEVMTKLGVELTVSLRTVVDIARSRPHADGLAVADGALRLKKITKQGLLAAAAKARGPGAKKVRWVAKHADRRAGSVIESKLRADLILGGVRGVRLQKRLDEHGHPFDIGIDDTDLLVEADGSGHREWERFQRDCEDGVEASLEDHEVLRFTGWQIMNRSEWVVSVVKARVKIHRQRRAKTKAKVRAARSRASTAASTQKRAPTAHVRS